MTGVRRRRQRGFTLIELMIALVVSSLLVGMILAIFARMSLAYRGQQQIAGVQQVLAAARAMIELDAKQAGFGMAQGFTAAPVAGVQSPVQVTDSSTGPDQIALFYAVPADPSTQPVVGPGSSWPTLLVDSTAGFLPGDLIVLSAASTTVASPLVGSPVASPSGEANIPQDTACVVEIDPTAGSVTATSITIAGTSVAPWGGFGHCAAPAAGTRIYKLVAHAYRIDTSTPARAALGPLQQSLTGGLLGGAEVWSDLAYGFTDLQTAERIVLPPPPAVPGGDPDADGDGYRDWYSDATQSAMNTIPPTTPLTTATLMQMSISLVARTDRDIEGIVTQKTPNLIDPAHPHNNAIGNRPSVDLPSATDPALQGQRIYRYVTFQVDFRNLGVGL